LYKHNKFHKLFLLNMIIFLIWQTMKQSHHWILNKILSSYKISKTKLKTGLSKIQVTKRMIPLEIIRRSPLLLSATVILELGLWNRSHFALRNVASYSYSISKKGLKVLKQHRSNQEFSARDAKDNVITFNHLNPFNSD